MYGRRVEAFGPGRRHLYLPGPHRGVWNHAGLQGTTEVIVCEALIDAMSFWSAGKRNVTSAYGVNGFTQDHRRVILQSGVKRVFIAFDADEAGDRGAAQLAMRLGGEGIACARVTFPHRTDANTFAQQATPTGSNLGYLIDHAIPLCDAKEGTNGDDHVAR